jgi:prepilin-type N-terminal cleavage/methylation domain-containing protein
MKLNRKGFTIIELAIVLSVILIIIGISSGIYFGVIKKGESAHVLRILSLDVSSAVVSFRYDMGDFPGTCGLNNSLRVLVDKSSLTGLQQRKWKGPYLDTGFTFNTAGDLVDDKGRVYCYQGVFAGVAGSFGRTVDGGTDHLIVAQYIPGEIATNIYQSMELRTRLADTGDAATRHVQYIIQQTY